MPSSQNTKIMDKIELNVEFLNQNRGTDECELILDTPNRIGILKDGPPENAKSNILGRGSYGVVFKAIYGGKQVAVKIMKNLNGEANAISNEANILGCRHRNIVQLLKIESTSNYGIVIMERFPGQCLQIILDSIDLPLEHRIYVTLDLANALMYCHRHGILHLDVKPQNILVAFSAIVHTSRVNGNLSATHTRAYICKLCDFGSSVMATENICRRVQGTVRYMSPEALREDILSPAADVFSLGVTMWQLKFRQLPYSWIECNESVAYQVVKTHLRPIGAPSQSKMVHITVSTSHKNCLCEHFSSEISYKSLEQIRTMLEKTRTLSPFKSKNTVNRQRPEKLKNQISRNLIGKFQSTFVGLKENLLVDEISCDISDEEFTDGFPLRELFRNKPSLTVPEAENLYEQLFISCWHNEPMMRPTIVNVKRTLMDLFWNGCKEGIA